MCVKTWARKIVESGLGKLVFTMVVYDGRDCFQGLCILIARAHGWNGVKRTEKLGFVFKKPVLIYFKNR